MSIGIYIFFFILLLKIGKNFAFLLNITDACKPVHNYIMFSASVICSLPNDDIVYPFDISLGPAFKSLLL